MEGFYLGNPRVNATSFRAKERGLRETGGIRIVIAVISTAVLCTRGCQGFKPLYECRYYSRAVSKTKGGLAHRNASRGEKIGCPYE